MMMLMMKTRSSRRPLNPLPRPTLHLPKQLLEARSSSRWLACLLSGTLKGRQLHQSKWKRQVVRNCRRASRTQLSLTCSPAWRARSLARSLAGRPASRSAFSSAASCARHWSALWRALTRRAELTFKAGPAARPKPRKRSRGKEGERAKVCARARALALFFGWQKSMWKVTRKLARESRFAPARPPASQPAKVLRRHRTLRSSSPKPARWAASGRQRTSCQFQATRSPGQLRADSPTRLQVSRLWRELSRSLAREEMPKSVRPVWRRASCDSALMSCIMQAASSLRASN